MNSLELIDKRDQLKIQAESIISVAEKESRKLTDDEYITFVKLKKQITDVKQQIRNIENET